MPLKKWRYWEDKAYRINPDPTRKSNYWYSRIEDSYWSLSVTLNLFLSLPLFLSLFIKYAFGVKWKHCNLFVANAFS